MPMAVPFKEKRSKAGWINLVLLPVKQHAICCGLVPLIASLAGGATAAVLESVTAEISIGIIVPPLVTFLIMGAEQCWHDRHTQGHACACAHILTPRNYLKQVAISYVIYIAAHLLLPHHHHLNG